MWSDKKNIVSQEKGRNEHNLNRERKKREKERERGRVNEKKERIFRNIQY